MNGGELHPDNNESSDDEISQKTTTLQDRRRRFYEERKMKMQKRNQPVSIADMLNAEPNQNPIEHEKRFLTVKVHTRIPKTRYDAKTEDESNLQHLVGELEIADYLTFEELVSKAIEMFNSQLKKQGSDIEISENYIKKFCFKLAKKTGHPDSNFPSFDNKQKVSDCGVTNV